MGHGWRNSPKWCDLKPLDVSILQAVSTAPVHEVHALCSTAPRSAALGSEWRRSTHSWQISCMFTEQWLAVFVRNAKPELYQGALMWPGCIPPSSNFPKITEHPCRNTFASHYTETQCVGNFSTSLNVSFTQWRKKNKKTRIHGYGAWRRTTAPEPFFNGHRSCNLQTKIKHGCNSHATANTCEAAFPTCQFSTPVRTTKRNMPHCLQPANSRLITWSTCEPQGLVRMSARFARWSH